MKQRHSRIEQIGASLVFIILAEECIIWLSVVFFN